MKSKMNSAYERTLNAWKKEWCAEHLSDDIQRLMNLSYMDLMYGPALQSDCDAPPRDEYNNENEWSGYDFVKACKLIKDALSDLPSELFIDCDCESWSTSEPGVSGCPECEGSGEAPKDFEHAEGGKCEACNGVGHIEPYLDNTYKVERRDLKRTIVGKELSEYV